MAQQRRFHWNKARDAFVQRGLNDGVSKTDIARELGISRSQLNRRIEEEAMQPQPKTRVFAPPSHIEKIRRARRGFDVPSHLEPAYFELLKRGVSIDEARRQLNLKKDED